MLVIVPIIILAIMVSMFRRVTNMEKKMENYGVRALRFRMSRTTTNGISAAQQQKTRGFAPKMKEMIGKYLCLTADDSQTNHLFFPIMCCFLRGGDACCDDPERPSRTTKSNKMTSQTKRAVLYMACFGYAGAWVLVWTPYFINVVFMIVTKSYPPDTLFILVGV